MTGHGVGRGGSLLAGWPQLDAAWLTARLRPVGEALRVPAADHLAAWDRIATRPATRAVVDRASRDGSYPELLAADWLRYHRTGDRLGHEGKISQRHAMLSRACMAATVTRNDAQLDRVVEGVWAFCEQASWCWPSHDDAHAVGAGDLPDVDRPYLDLGAGEVAAQLAWVDHVLPGLESRAPGLRRRVRREVRRRVFDPFLERDDWQWLGLDGDVHNWLPWICGNVLVAALALVDDPDLRARLVLRAVAGLDRYVASLPADGAIDEGYGYWWNGACRAIEALDLLAFATDGALGDWSAVPVLRATVGFPAAMHLGGDWYVNVADGSARPLRDLAWPSLWRAAVATGDAPSAAHALAHRDPGDVTSEEGRLGRLLLELTDDQWWDAPAGDALPARDVWLPSVQLMVARARAGSSAGLTLVAKGGHNGEHHNHNDVGSFIVALDGVPVLVDLGRPTYTAATFGPGRYDIPCLTSPWHNVPRVRGSAQAPGAEFAARDVAHTATDDAAHLSLDLAAAYPRSDIITWRRGLELDRVSGQVTVTDAWQLDGEASEPSELVMVVAGTVSRVSARELVVRPVEGGGALRLLADRDLTVEAAPLDDEMLTSVWGMWVNRVIIDLNCDKNDQATVTVTACTEGEAR